MRFDGARMTTMRSRRARKSCWRRRPRSMLNRTSKLPRARRSNSPFVVPDQLAACTVPTSCPANSAARARGRFSSSRTRTGQNGIPSRIECGNRLLLRDRRELIEELVEGLSPFQIVEHRLNRHPRAAEDRHTPRDLRVAVDDRERIDHAIIIRHRSGRGARRVWLVFAGPAARTRRSRSRRLSPRTASRRPHTPSVRRGPARRRRGPRRRDRHRGSGGSDLHRRLTAVSPCPGPVRTEAVPGAGVFDLSTPGRERRCVRGWCCNHSSTPGRSSLRGPLTTGRAGPRPNRVWRHGVRRRSTS